MVVAQLQLKFKEVEGKVRKWMGEQSAPVEVAITTAASALQGGAIGGLMGNLTQDVANVAPTASMTAEASKTMQQLKVLLFSRSSATLLFCCRAVLLIFRIIPPTGSNLPN